MLPISTASLVAYASITAMLVLAPGMSTALVLRNTAEGGHLAGLVTALGIAIGNATWALAAGLGLGILLNGIPGALSALRLAGGAGLIWLGVRSLNRAWQLKSAGSSAVTSTPPPRTKPPHGLTMLGEGAATNLLNPSIPVFYIATVPQFIHANDRFVTAFFLLGAIHVVMALACHSAYAVAFGRIAVALTARGRAWTLHALTGAALVALAAFSLRSTL